MSRPLSLRLYRAVSHLASWLAPLWLAARVRRGKEDAGRWREKLGEASEPRPGGRVAWLHGVSVGESLSLLPLIEQLARTHPDVTVLVTSGTRASGELLVERLPSGVIHQYAALDTPRAVARFLRYWRPGIGVRNARVTIALAHTTSSRPGSSISSWTIGRAVAAWYGRSRRKPSVERSLIEA